MSDERLRECQRRFERTGAVEDEATLLLERVRTGSVERDRLRLAAYLGQPAASRALGSEAPEPATLAIFEDWNWLLPYHGAGHGLPPRAALASARCTLAPHGLDADRTVIDMMARVAEWIADPTEARASGMEPCAYTADAGPAYHAREALQFAWEAVRCHRSLPTLLTLPDIGGGIALTALVPPQLVDVQRWRFAAIYASRATCSAASAVGAEVVLQALRDELLPWALGCSDPVLERVLARRRDTRGRLDGPSTPPAAIP